MKISKPCFWGILVSVLLLPTFIFAKEDTSALFEGFDYSTKKQSYEFIDSSFDDLQKIFAKTLTTSDQETDELWNEYQGKYVRWQGIVTYKGIGKQDRNRVGIKHSVGTNVEILFDEDKEMIVGMINTMDRITYTGRLSQLLNRNLMFEIIDATIEEINGVGAEEFVENKFSSSSQSSRDEVVDKESDGNSSSTSEAGDAPYKSTEFTFDDLDTIFGKNSDLPFVQKEKLWNTYKGNIVQWRGIVAYKNTIETNLSRIGITHTAGTNIELVFNPGEVDENVIGMIKRGDDITYTGELAKLFGRNLLCSIVNIEILKIGDKPLPGNKDENSSQPNSNMPDDADVDKKNRTEVVVAESMAPDVIKKDELGIITTPDGFIQTSFEEIDKIFGNESRMTETQKDKLWKEYQGKLVRWQGKVVNRGLGRVSGLRMGVSHSNITDVELCFNVMLKDIVLSTNPGDMITYTGRLVKRRGYILPFRVEEGKIEQVQAVEPSPDSEP
ncbi:MAG: hypothetical protein GY941_13940 [Planctomycetes bacterium]|nr:hypothetical protein [Planctomycetota bacterium]